MTYQCWNQTSESGSRDISLVKVFQDNLCSDLQITERKTCPHGLCCVGAVVFYILQVGD